MTVQVVQGDCVGVLRARTGELFDSCVTDPPYELGFMGRAWDSSGVAFQVETWRAVYDQLKPGAHLVAFSSTRTYHRMAVAIEDAGFEIRDQLAWCYGSGFPKSADVAKMIDKHDANAVRRDRALRFTEWMRSTGITAAAIAELTGTNMASHYLTAKEQPAVATRAHLDAMRPALGDVPAWIEDLVDDRVVESENWNAREVTGEHVEWADRSNYALTSADGLRRDRAHSPEAQEWEGWGTALKPAWEPICLARKPLQGTIAANVLAHGAGGLNIDACRLEVADASYARNHSGDRGHGGTRSADQEGATDIRAGGGNASAVGRFPANVLHDGSPEVLAAFPNSAAGGAVTNKAAAKSAGIYGAFNRPEERWGGYADDGSAARFFYSAKAGPLDRLGSEHTTVKPVDVMRWLVRLTTRRGGLCLDPFGGSGTTGIAALAEGVRCELIELLPEHVADIETKLAHLRGQGARIMERHLKRKAARRAADALPLFGGQA